MGGPTPGPSRRRGEPGTALVGTLVGFAILMVLLLLAVQIVVRLYATSVLTSAATQAAQQVASAPSPSAAVPAAEAQARSDLGSTRVVFDWREVDGQQVVLHVSAPSPEFLPGIPGWRRISRTITVRTERFR
jgi:type VI protein secretion system component VasK